MMTTEPRSDAFSVTVDERMRVREGEWDGARGRRELFEWATDPDGKTDLAKAARGHTVADLAVGTRAALKLPIAYVEGDEPVAIGNGLRAALSRLPQADEEFAEVAAMMGLEPDELRAFTLPDSPEEVEFSSDGLSSEVRAEAKRKLTAMLDRLKEQTADELDCEDPRAEADRRDREAWTLLGHQLRIVDERRRTPQRVWRFSRHRLSLDARAQAAVDRALSIADSRGTKSDADTMKAVAAELHRDGFDDYLTPEGYLKLKVWAARDGVQIYSDGFQQWGELRPTSEVGDEESLASWALKCLTDDHPPDLVNSETYREYTVGTCGQDACLAMPAKDGHRYVELTILIGDIGALRKVARGKLELSAGYTAIMVLNEGVDFDGQRHSYEQTKIRINHLAIVDAGRAGPLARISIDGAAWQVLPKDQTTTMADSKKIDNPELVRAFIATAFKLGDYLRAEMPDTAMEIGEKLASIATAAFNNEPPNPDDVSALAQLTGMSEEELQTMLARPESGEEESSNTMNEQQQEMVEVDLGDSIGVVKMTKDQATAWKTAKEAADAANAAAAAAASDHGDAATLATKLAEAERKLADQGGELIGLTRTVTQLERTALLANCDALMAEAAPVCPDLAKHWADDKKKGQLETNSLTRFTRVFAVDDRHKAPDLLTQMRASMVIDMDGGAKEELQREWSERPDNFDALIRSLHRTTLAATVRRRAASDSSVPASPPPSHTPISTLTQRIATDAYGVEPPAPNN